MNGPDLTAELDAAEAEAMHGAMTRGELRDAVVHAMRHLRHPYSNGAACVEEILAAAGRYAGTADGAVVTAGGKLVCDRDGCDEFLVLPGGVVRVVCIACEAVYRVGAGAAQEAAS